MQKEEKEQTGTTDSNAEKPVSLFGAKFEEVAAALLKTRPKPNDNGDGNGK